MPVEDGGGGEWLADAGQAAAVGEEHAERRRVLAVGGELGPIPGDGSIEVELAAFDERQSEHRRDALADGVGIDEGVAAPGGRRSISR